jgi:AcrR family transcriptional regulator
VTPITHRSDTRARMIEGATELFRQRGYSGTGFRDVVALTGAPRGSIYHHFPGGKAELAGEVIRTYAEDLAVHMLRTGDRDDPLSFMRAYVRWVRAGLRESRLSGGCPIVAVIVDSPEGQELREAADGALSAMANLMSDAFERSGVPADRAADLADLTVAAVEGAVILCRAKRDLAPLENVERELERSLGAALPD